MMGVSRSSAKLLCGVRSDRRPFQAAGARLFRESVRDAVRGSGSSNRRSAVRVRPPEDQRPRFEFHRQSIAVQDKDLADPSTEGAAAAYPALLVLVRGAVGAVIPGAIDGGLKEKGARFAGQRMF